MSRVSRMVWEFLGWTTVPIPARSLAELRVQAWTWLRVHRAGARISARSSVQDDGLAEEVHLAWSGDRAETLVFLAEPTLPPGPLLGLDPSCPVPVASVEEEYTWIWQVLGGRVCSQSLRREPGAWRDVLTVVLPDGEAIVWFDISALDGTLEGPRAVDEP